MGGYSTRLGLVRVFFPILASLLKVGRANTPGKTLQGKCHARAPRRGKMTKRKNRRSRPNHKPDDEPRSSVGVKRSSRMGEKGKL